MTFKIITYNIDGLPYQLDLSDLPWILKPIKLIYKLFKKTTIITINDNENIEEKIKNIGNYFFKQYSDIITIQEDFNYHNELIRNLNNYYIFGKHLGGFDLKNIFKNVNWFPRPRFKIDGLNLFVKNNIQIKEEKIIPWNKSYGYISHANDLLIYKGFRYYILEIGNKFKIDLYNIHMDADFYHPENCPDIHQDLEARKSQFIQLTDMIISNYNSGNINPVIIIGDTNSYNKYEWDKENININLLHKINHDKSLNIQEAIPNNYEDCDRIFYINNDKSQYKIDLIECEYDLEQKQSDHFPLIAKFNIIENE